VAGHGCAGRTDSEEGAAPPGARPLERRACRRKQAGRRPWASLRSLRVSARARRRARRASSATWGPATAVRSPERARRANGPASRRSVGRRAPGFWGISEGAPPASVACLAQRAGAPRAAGTGCSDTDQRFGLRGPGAEHRGDGTRAGANSPKRGHWSAGVSRAGGHGNRVFMDLHTAAEGARLGHGCPPSLQGMGRHQTALVWVRSPALPRGAPSRCTGSHYVSACP
jgi:hypothetical protein